MNLSTARPLGQVAQQDAGGSAYGPALACPTCKGNYLKHGEIAAEQITGDLTIAIACESGCPLPPLYLINYKGQLFLRWGME